jgi:hypothetical protein
LVRVGANAFSGSGLADHRRADVIASRRQIKSAVRALFVDATHPEHALAR